MSGNVPNTPPAVVVQGKRVKRKRIWYLIPVEALGGRLTINLYPFGCRKDGEERFEEYRGAWALLTTQDTGLAGG
jgi:hypothetical protein